MRLMRISLAAKYRILFGLAVVIIIGAALCVPWYQLESLVLEQPFGEARRVAEDFFRQELADPHGGTIGGGGAHADGLGAISSTQQPKVQFIARSDRPQREVPAEFRAIGPNDNKFVERSMEAFGNKQRPEYYREPRETPNGRRHLYAFPVWVKPSCLKCHGDAATARSEFVENEFAGMIVVNLPAESSRQGIVGNRLLITVAGLLAGVLAILVFYVITHRFILSPINELRGVAIQVAEGDLGVRSGLQTGDEFEHLADSINTMLERLRDSQDELMKANVLLDQRLGEIAETNVNLYESNRVKSEFIANVSHELRTPLTSIIGFAELLREGPAVGENDKLSRYAENILISGRILLEIINDLLDLAKIEAGKVELNIEEVDVGELCGTLVDFARPLAEKKALNVILERADDCPMILTDRGRIRQILFNLLSNGIKFTPDEGHVWIRTSPTEEGGVQIDIADTGPGIDEKDHEIIFDKFRQTDQSKTREHEGTGLGLAIAKEFTQLLGGTIGVKSRLGEGATFTVRFPVAASEAVKPRGNTSF